MRPTTCAEEQRLVQAAASGLELDQASLAHVSSCATCQEAVSVSRWMASIAVTTGETRPLPNAELLWWKAQMLRRWEGERRVAAPIERMQRVELGAAAIGAVALLIWQWGAIGRAFSAFTPDHLATISKSAGTSPALPALLLGVVLFGGLVLAGVHRLISES
jgi:hypothetical protein